MIKVTVNGTIDIDADEFARVAREQLGMELPPVSGGVPALDPFEALPGATPALADAIKALIRAGDKLERDRYTAGEQAAVSALIRAANHLRLEARKAKFYQSKKGKARENSNA